MCYKLSDGISECNNIYLNSCQMNDLNNEKRIIQNKNPADKSRQDFRFGRGRRTRTLTNGFGDRCATIDTIPLCNSLL